MGSLGFLGLGQGLHAEGEERVKDSHVSWHRGFSCRAWRSGSDSESTLTHQNLPFCRVPINSILGFINRTDKKVGFGRLRAETGLGFGGSGSTWRGRGLRKSFISRVIIGVTPFRVLITLLITYLLSPLPLQVGLMFQGLGSGIPG